MEVTTWFEALWICVIDLLLKKISEILVHLQRVGTKVDSLKIGDDLTEFSEIEKYNLALVVRNLLLTNSSIIDEFHEY